VGGGRRGGGGRCSSSCVITENYFKLIFCLFYLLWDFLKQLENNCLKNRKKYCINAILLFFKHMQSIIKKRINFQEK
jgi:hypothetical protein